MERHDIIEAMSERKLYGNLISYIPRASFDEIAGRGSPGATRSIPFLPV